MFPIFLMFLMFFSTDVFAGSGVLYRVEHKDNNYTGFDMSYQDDMNVSRQDFLNGKIIKLQSRFIWSGSGDVNCCQHSLVAVTQMVATDSPIVGTNPRQLFTHGAGALVGEFGLGMELWFREVNVLGRYEGVKTDAFVWTQNDNKCMKQVNNPYLANNLLCLSSDENLSGYITSNTNFKLRKNVQYWLRMTLQKAVDNPSFATLTAELIENIEEPVLVQKGSIGFPIDVYFPDLGQSLNPVVARTPGTIEQRTIVYDSFNTGF